MKRKRPSGGRACDHHTLQTMRQQAVKAVRESQMLVKQIPAESPRLRQGYPREM